MGFERALAGERRVAVARQEGGTLLTVAMEPLAYNQLIGGPWGARVHEPANSNVHVRDHAHGFEHWFDAVIIRVLNIKKT